MECAQLWLNFDWFLWGRKLHCLVVWCVHLTPMANSFPWLTLWFECSYKSTAVSAKFSLYESIFSSLHCSDIQFCVRVISGNQCQESVSFHLKWVIFNYSINFEFDSFNCIIASTPAFKIASMRTRFLNRFEDHTVCVIAGVLGLVVTRPTILSARISRTWIVSEPCASIPIRLTFFFRPASSTWYVLVNITLASAFKYNQLCLHYLYKCLSSMMQNNVSILRNSTHLNGLNVIT